MEPAGKIVQAGRAVWGHPDASRSSAGRHHPARDGTRRRPTRQFRPDRIALPGVPSSTADGCAPTLVGSWRLHGSRPLWPVRGGSMGAARSGRFAAAPWEPPALDGSRRLHGSRPLWTVRGGSMGAARSGRFAAAPWEPLALAGSRRLHGSRPLWPVRGGSMGAGRFARPRRPRRPMAEGRRVTMMDATGLAARRTRLEGVQAVSARSSRSYPRHTHDQFGIGVMLAGAHVSRSGRGEVEAHAGHLITVNPGEVHDGRPVAGEPRAWRMLFFDPEVIAPAGPRELGAGRAPSGHVEDASPTTGASPRPSAASTPASSPRPPTPRQTLPERTRSSASSRHSSRRPSITARPRPIPASRAPPVGSTTPPRSP